jgi:hypothetical protein
MPAGNCSRRTTDSLAHRIYETDTVAVIGLWSLTA